MEQPIFTIIAIALISAVLGLIFTTFAEKIVLLLNKYFARKGSEEYKKELNIELLSEEFVSRSLNKLRSNDINEKYIGLSELRFGWINNANINKERLLDELIIILSDEVDKDFRIKLINLMHDLVKENEKNPSKKIGLQS
jgi:hypothetical protein